MCPTDWLEMAAWRIRNREILETQSMELLPIVKETHGIHDEYDKIADNLKINREKFNKGMHGMYIFNEEEMQIIKEYMNDCKYIKIENGIPKCSKCGSKNISIKAGFTTDLYICMDCGNEMR